MRRRIDGAAHRRQVAGHAAGGVGVHHHHGADPVVFVFAQGLLDRSHVKGMALLVGRALHSDTQPLDLDRPLVRKMARARQQQGVLRRRQVGRCRLPHAVAVAGKQEHLGVWAVQQSLHAAFTFGDHGRHPGVGQIGHGALHGVHDLVGHMGRSRRMHKPDAGDAGSGR